MKRLHSSLAGGMARDPLALNWHATNGQQTTGALPWFVRFENLKQFALALNGDKSLAGARLQPGKFLPWSDQNDK